MKMTRSPWLLGLALLPLFGVGCASPLYDDIQLDSQADPQASFAGYRNYAWGGVAAVLRDPEREWTPPDLDLGAEVMHLVNRELRESGRTEVASGPDFFVFYAIGVDMQALDVVVDQDGGFSRLEKTPSGGLGIFFVEANTRRLLWTGVATAELSEEPTVDLVKKRLDYAIGKLFDRAPL